MKQNRKSKTTKNLENTPFSPQHKRNQSSQENNFLIVGIGASAGGLEAFTHLLKALPEKTGMAFVFIQHISPTHKSLAPQILTQETKMPLQEATDGMPIKANQVYLIPPNSMMTINDGLFNISQRKSTSAHPYVIDLFFNSLASHKKNQAIGVILSGSGTDGTQGLRSIRASGGVGLVQTPDSAKYQGMSNNAISFDTDDFVGTPEQIAEELIRISKHTYFQCDKKDASLNLSSKEKPKNLKISDEEALSKIFDIVRRETRADFSNYKKATTNRRIHRRMMVKKASNIPEYLEILESSPNEVYSLYTDMLIHVTEFFRDPKSFESLGRTVITYHLKSRDFDTPFRIWVPGCSTGEEAYSLVILLFECMEEARRKIPVQIFATDISEPAIQFARSGRYSAKIESSVNRQRLKRFFTKEGNGYKINKEIRDHCLFSVHDVTNDPPFSKIDIISCRNLLIYFESPLQKRVMSLFQYALKPDGLLWLGTSETTGQSIQFTAIDKLHKIFMKSNNLKTSTVSFPTSQKLDKLSKLPFEYTKPFGQDDDLYKEADKIALSKYVPPSVIINAQMDIKQFRGRTVPFIEQGTGPPSSNLVKMVRPELLIAITKSIKSSIEQKTSIRQENLYFLNEDQQIGVNIEVVPLNIKAEPNDLKFIIFFERTTVVKPRTTSESDPTMQTNNSQDIHNQRVYQLEQDLLVCAQNQKSIVENFDLIQEELTTANEELQSSNEEYQSTNEELETAKEELQSSNEELKTVNEELYTRNADLTVLSDDLNNLLKSANIPILIVDSNHHIRQFTPVASNVLHLSANDIGRPIKDVQSGFDLDFDILISKANEKLGILEIEIQNKDNQWWRLQIRPYKTTENKIDGAVLSFIDIEILKQQVNEAKRAENYLISVAETVRLPLVILDDKLRLISANKIFWETFNLTNTQKENFFDCWNLCGENAKDNEQKITHLLNQRLNESQGEKNLELDCDISSVGKRSLLISANRIHWQWNSTPKSPEPVSILMSIEDITESKRIKRELEDLFEKEKKALGEADKANLAKDLFLATLSHELRTPLSAILTWAQLIKSGKVDFDKAKEGAQVIENSALNQCQLIDDLLDITRIVSGKLVLDIKEVDLRSAAESAISSVELLAKKRSIKIDQQLNAEPVMIDADPIRIQQVIWNLLTNAIKFSPQNSTINVTVRELSNSARIIVSDLGKGIPTEFLPHIFTKFSQADSSTNRVHGGLGLGLSIVHNLVSLQGGTIIAENKTDGKGAIFTVTFPIISSRGKEGFEKINCSKSNKGKTQQSVPDLKGVSILYVEDDESTRDAINLYLESFGAKVTCAGSTKDALALFRDTKVDVLVSDIAMPEEDGYSLIQKIRKLPRSKRGSLPAIALTAYATPEDSKRALDAGFQKHLSKPTDAHELGWAILKAIY